MTQNDGDMTKNVLATFIGYDCEVKKHGSAKGGGYLFTIECSDSEWEQLKEINSPSLSNRLVRVVLIAQKNPT